MTILDIFIALCNEYIITDYLKKKNYIFSKELIILFLD